MPTAPRFSPSPVVRTALAVALATLFACGAPVSFGQTLSPGVTPAPAPLPPSREDTSGLTADTFYRVILGDVALQRGEKSLAARAYYEAARDARAPGRGRRGSRAGRASPASSVPSSVRTANRRTPVTAR